MTCDSSESAMVDDFPKSSQCSKLYLRSSSTGAEGDGSCGATTFGISAVSSIDISVRQLGLM